MRSRTQDSESRTRQVDNADADRRAAPIPIEGIVIVLLVLGWLVAGILSLYFPAATHAPP